ncbi:MAG TPA: T9SS type A sorting domain-containing protein [Chitinophagaceae bacterium]
MSCFLWRPFLLTTFSRSWLLILFLFSTLFSFSQTTNINGIINSYHSVLGVDATKNALKLDNVSGLAYGNTVLIIQMKGATINTTASSSSFGDVTALNDAGNYEIAIICSVSNDSVYFFNTIKNNYDVNFKVQLVKFGEYYSANVTDTVKAQSWNNTTGKGGVLAIQVEEDLTLNAPLFADSTGYKGGNFYLHTTTFCIPAATNWAYSATSTSTSNGAYKGEGVADFAASINGGRGAPANGGGGGNFHNNGGGGGANLSTGGNGGGNFSTTGCTGSRPGLAGKALNNTGGTKIFLGGGGGAGHANGTVQPFGGGNGGGIIIVFAKNVIGNGHKISSNGQAGRSTSYDGAAGGGGGGTIIMNVTGGYPGSLNIHANGGNGGNEDDDNSLNRCYGAGGGGSGGVLYFNGSLPGVGTSYTGGIAGINMDVNGCGTPVPAVNGTSGSAIPNYSYQTSLTPSASCTFSLPIRIIYFNAIITGYQKVKLEWDIANPQEATSFTIEKLNSLNKWTDLSTIDAQTNLHHYEIPDNAPVAGENIYRLRVNGKDNSASYSIQKRVHLKFNDRFFVYPNPAKDKITIRGKLNTGTVIELTDLTGKEIKKIITNTSSSFIELQLPSIDPGIYILRVDNYTQKIIILH